MSKTARNRADRSLENFVLQSSKNAGTGRYATKVLREPRTGKVAKSAAGSALTQRPSHKKG